MIRDSISPRTRAAYAPHYVLELGKAHTVCIVQGCNRSARPLGCICYTHDRRLWRLKHPERAQYHRLKAKAKKRRKAFDLTWPEFQEICRLTRYHEGTASKCGSVRYGLTLDRIRHTGGYTLDNLRVITHSENASKGAHEKKCRLHTGRYITLRNAAVSVAEEIERTEEELINSL